MLGLWRKSQRMLSSPKKRKAKSVSKGKKKARKPTNVAANMENLMNMSLSELRKRNRKGGLLEMVRREQRKAAAIRASRAAKTFAPKVKAAKKRPSSPTRPSQTGRGRGRGHLPERIYSAASQPLGAPIGRGKGKGRGRGKGKGVAPTTSLAQLAANTRPSSMKNKQAKHCVACGHALATERFHTETLAVCKRCGVVDPSGQVWQYNLHKNMNNGEQNKKTSPKRNSPK